MSDIILRTAQKDDLAALVQLEQACFSGDRLSKRRFKHWLEADNGIFIVARDNHMLLGYGLVLLHQGTRLARLYSIAIDDRARGQGVAKKILAELEVRAAQVGRLFMRLEVAENNAGAIALYQSAGYRIFGEYSDYYEDHSDALRMQKRIRTVGSVSPELVVGYHDVPWFRQNTEFTCGPASLLMAMGCLDAQCELSREQELDIWREATTIFMTSGHGGCHPIGLALAAQRRGYQATAFVNTQAPLFIEGVRTEHKKSVMTLVDEQFKNKAQAEGVIVEYCELSLSHIEHWLQNNYAVIVLISTYRLDGRKAPHWVTVTAIDDMCLYVHDPDLDEKIQVSFDCQHIPIARDDFVKMQTFGRNKLRTAVAIKRLV